MTIEVKDLKVGKAFATEEIHFSGGLRGMRTNHGWALFPVSDDENESVLLFQNVQFCFQFAIRECGLRFVGSCTRHAVDENSPPMDVWMPGERDSSGLNAADSWAAVAYQAESKRDNQYSDIASYVSVCLRVAGLRLRDVSNKYHEQLRWALHKRTAAGNWFSNAALLDLYADFHSLVTEMCSTRDYLAKLAAIHAGAPENIDCLAWLEPWLAKPANRAYSTQPVAQLLLLASGTKDSPGWLRRLGDIRNEMLHRIPMGANKRVSGLMLQDVRTSLGMIKVIRLAQPASRVAIADQSPDPFVELSQLCANLERLCSAACELAKYPASPPHLTTGPVS